jgi:hypothetical protein
MCCLRQESPAAATSNCVLLLLTSRMYTTVQGNSRGARTTKGGPGLAPGRGTVHVAGGGLFGERLVRHVDCMWMFGERLVRHVDCLGSGSSGMWIVWGAARQLALAVSKAPKEKSPVFSGAA